VAESNQRPTEARWIGYLPVLVLVVSAVLLAFFWLDMSAARRRAVDDHFQADAHQVAAKIAQRLEAHEDVLLGAAGLFAASEEVSRDEFRRYLRKFRRGRVDREGQSVGFSIWIPADGLDEQVRKIRAEGFPDFSVWPSGPREAYTSIVFLEPFSGQNLRAFGYDMFAEPVPREAMEGARDRGQATMSGRVKPAQETEAGPQADLLSYVPVYRDGAEPRTEAERRALLMGWVYSPLRMDDLMAGVLEDEPFPLWLEIFDGGDPVGEHLLYDSRRGDTGPASFSITLPLQVNQRTWTLRFGAGDSVPMAEAYRGPWLGFLGMAAIAFLLTGLSAALVASRRAHSRETELSRSLRESEERYRIIFERAPVGIFTADADGRFISVNSTYCQITGWSAQELRGMTRDQIVHPDDRPLDRELLRQLRSGERSVGTTERRGVRKDGTVFWAAVTLSLEEAQTGEAANVLGVLDDVTARREAEEKFRVIAERSLNGIFIVQDDRIVYANPAASELAGVPAEELTGMSSETARSLILPEDRPRVLRAAAEAEAPVAGTARAITYRVARPAGGVRDVEQMARPIQHLGHPAMLVTFLDVTEREKAEAETRKAQRLESLGLVAGGIAHDFNNLLTAVFGQVEEARAQLSPEAPAARELDVALSALARSRDLTRQLLTFSTGGAPARKILPVRKLIEDAVKLGLGGSALRAHIQAAPDLPPVEADEGQMSQLLNNLLVNARQATPGAGDVTIRADRRKVVEGEVPSLPAGAYVQISIQDTGQGIPEHLLPKVFDPFFTTRPTGTGLGLATSYSIVRRHGGHVSIASRVGEGTTVTLLLPAARGEAAREVAAPAVRALAGGLRILLMDDEPLVLKVGARHLRKLGFEVETAARGEEAVEMYRRRWADGDPYGVVILDLTVPGGMGGAEALERLREIDPGVIAIACSGYFEDGIMAEPGKFGFAGMLGKPYLTADLERVLASVVAPGR
jgi:PAS domain S-box-containing protein